MSDKQTDGLNEKEVEQRTEDLGTIEQSREDEHDNKYDPELGVVTAPFANKEQIHHDEVYNKTWETEHKKK